MDQPRNPAAQVFAQFGVTVFRVFLVRIPLRLALSVMGIKLEEKHADLRRLGLRCVQRLAQDEHVACIHTVWQRFGHV